MSILTLIVMALLFFYQFTYARKQEIEKILSATNKGQEEERSRIALELHDSVIQQMRYVSLLAEKISDEELSKEIKTNQTQCVENIRNACYILSSINMDKSSFSAVLKSSVDSFQKRTGISTSLIITDDGKGIDSKLLEMMNSKKILSIKTMHFGLQNIKLRLNQINGSIRYFSEAGEGTEVEIRIGK